MTHTKGKKFKYNTKDSHQIKRDESKRKRNNNKKLQNNQETIKMAIRAYLSIITKEYLHGFE